MILSKGITVRISFWFAALYLLRFLVAKVIRFLGGNFSGEPGDLKRVLSLEKNACSASLIESAFKFEDVSKNGGYWVADYHTHVHGTGSNDGVNLFCPNIQLDPPGVLLTPKRFQWFSHPLIYLQTKVFISASGIKNIEYGDVEYLQRFYRLIEHFPVYNDSHENPVKFRFSIFAMAPVYDLHSGDVNLDKTDICVDSDYVIAVAECFNRKLEAAGVPHRVVPVISVHPYRKDAEDELIRLCNKVKSDGHDEVLLKWLPSAMGIDPRLVRDSYYETMAEQGMVLITHTGKEHSAIADHESQEFSNPLHLVKALDVRSISGKQLTVIMAHSGRKGDNFNTEGKKRKSYDLFKEMMKSDEYRGRLFGDMSAIPYKETDRILAEIANRENGLQGRMLNGSDYPVPAGNIIKPVRSLRRKGLISREQAEALNLLYGYNPLLFDFAMKRMLRFGNRNDSLPDSAFLSISPH